MDPKQVKKPKVPTIPSTGIYPEDLQRKEATRFLDHIAAGIIELEIRTAFLAPHLGTLLQVVPKILFLAIVLAV